jgi:hypothetical protein
MGFADAQPSPLPSSLPHPLRPLEQTLRCYNSLRGVLRPHIHLIVPAICKLISQLQDLSGKETIQWQTKSIATLRRICTSARGAIVEQVRVLHLTEGVPVARPFVDLISTTCATPHPSCVHRTMTVAHRRIADRALPHPDGDPRARARGAA